MNRAGRGEIEAIIGGIVAIFFLIIFVSAMIPLFQSLTGADEKQGEIDKLRNENSALQQNLANKEVEISASRSLLESLNATVSQKDSIISNLSGQITEKEKEIAELQEEIRGYQEKEYLPTINNNYYSILNYVEKIENKFYTINLAIGLISLTLVSIIVKIFGVDVKLKLLWQWIRRRETHTTVVATNN